MGTNPREDCFVSDLKHPLFSRSETSFSLVPQPTIIKYGFEYLACLNIISESCGDVIYVSLSVNIAGKFKLHILFFIWFQDISFGWRNSEPPWWCGKSPLISAGEWLKVIGWSIGELRFDFKILLDNAKSAIQGSHDFQETHLIYCQFLLVCKSLD